MSLWMMVLAIEKKKKKKKNVKENERNK